MTLVEKIKMLARAHGITISGLETTLGFAGGAISKWDRNIPASDKVLKVANFFGTTTDYLLRDELENPIAPQDMENLPVTYFHLLNGAKELELSGQDIDFLLDVARRYKLIGTEEKK